MWGLRTNSFLAFALFLIASHHPSEAMEQWPANSEDMGSIIVMAEPALGGLHDAVVTLGSGAGLMDAVTWDTDKAFVKQYLLEPGVYQVQASDGEAQELQIGPGTANLLELSAKESLDTKAAYVIAVYPLPDGQGLSFDAARQHVIETLRLYNAAAQIHFSSLKAEHEELLVDVVPLTEYLPGIPGWGASTPKPIKNPEPGTTQDEKK